MAENPLDDFRDLRGEDAEQEEWKFKEKKEEEKRKPEKEPEAKSKPKISSNAIYMIILGILLLFIIADFGFYHPKLKSGEVIKEKTAEEPIKVTVLNKTEAKNETKKEAEAEKEEEETAAKKEEQELSGSIMLTMDKVHYEKVEDDLGHITQIDFTISNGKSKVLTPVVYVYVYDDELDESWETRSRGEYTYAAGIKAGGKHSGSINVVPKTFTNLDLKKSVRLALNDTEDGFITAVNDGILIS